jgi:demethoxyubiquinone hydroxylase (CLK1/Coq7/Cat5 family)
MLIDDRELDRLNFYRASELHGGLILGQLALRTREPHLLEQLTRHSAEEVVHAQLWTDTIVAVGGRLRPVRRTYQTLYAEAVGGVSSIFQVLALTQVFERRVYRHFIEHERRAGTHPLVRQTLRRMVEEEKDHLSWVKDWLDASARRRGVDLHAALAPWVELDDRVYAELAEEYGWRAPRPAERVA